MSRENKENDLPQELVLCGGSLPDDVTLDRLFYRTRGSGRGIKDPKPPEAWNETMSSGSVDPVLKWSISIPLGKLNRLVSAPGVCATLFDLRNFDEKNLDNQKVKKGPRHLSSSDLRLLQTIFGKK